MLRNVLLIVVLVFVSLLSFITTPKNVVAHEEPQTSTICPYFEVQIQGHRFDVVGVYKPYFDVCVYYSPLGLSVSTSLDGEVLYDAVWDVEVWGPAAEVLRWDQNPLDNEVELWFQDFSRVFQTADGEYIRQYMSWDASRVENLALEAPLDIQLR